MPEYLRNPADTHPRCIRQIPPDSIGLFWVWRLPVAQDKEPVLLETKCASNCFWNTPYFKPPCLPDPYLPPSPLGHHQPGNEDDTGNPFYLYHIVGLPLKRIFGMDR